MKTRATASLERELASTKHKWKEETEAKQLVLQTLEREFKQVQIKLREEDAHKVQVNPF